MFERLHLSPSELRIFRCKPVPRFDDNASIFTASITQLLKCNGPRDDMRGFADATTRFYLIPVENLLPQGGGGKELCVDLLGRGPDLWVVLLQSGLIMGASEHRTTHSMIPHRHLI